MEFVIAVDGPAGSGKSTIAKNIAEIFNLTYIDTGAMYRMVTLKLLKEYVDLSDITKIKMFLSKISMDINENRFILNGEDVTEAIRTREISNNVSKVAAIKEVREYLVEMQRFISKGKKVILDGRDIGTVVFPNANLKIFLDASPMERARRRKKEYEEKGIKVNIEDILKDIVERDKMDMERENSPLVKAKNAIEIDTTSKRIEEVTQKVAELIEKEIIKKIINIYG